VDLLALFLIEEPDSPSQAKKSQAKKSQAKQRKEKKSRLLQAAGRLFSSLLLYRLANPVYMDIGRK